MNTKVIVLGHNYASKLSAIRALGVAGFDVALVSFSKKKWFSKPIEAWSKYVRECVYCPTKDPKKLADILITHFAGYDGKVAILPTSDLSASLIDAEYNRLSNYFLLPNVNAKHRGILELMDKQKQKKIAIEAGLNVAKTRFLSLDVDKFSIPDDIHYPCFPKPASSVAGGKNGMCKCSNAEELQIQLHKLVSKGCVKIAIEDYLTIDREYAVVGCTDGVNVSIPGVLYLKEMTHGSHFGVAMSGVIMPNDSFGRLLDEFKHFVRTTGYKGLFDIDFFDCQGKYYFGEFNLRPGASIGAYTNNGVNLPQLYVQSILEDYSDLWDATINETKEFINDRSCILEWQGGFMPFHRMLNMIAKKEGFVYNNSDKLPLLPFWCDLSKQVIKQIIKRK